MLNPATGEPILKCQNRQAAASADTALLVKFGITTRREAKEKAGSMAESFAELEEPEEEPDAGSEQPPRSINRLLDL